MKEEADKVRSWKMKKEKEVNQLKQAERKQQVQLTKMANLNAKQQNVLRRKMEEAVAANKRLKDVIDKQKAAKKMQSMGKQGKKGNLCIVDRAVGSGGAIAPPIILSMRKKWHLAPPIFLE